jgi:hypothetical protein
MSELDHTKLSLGRLRLLRRRGDFDLYAEVDAPARAVVMATQETDFDTARARIGKLVEAHHRARDPVIAAIAGTGQIEGRPCVAFDCAAVSDMLHVLEMMQACGTHVPYELAIAFIDKLFRTITAAEQARATVGALSAVNLVVGPSGAFYFIGLGDNLLALDAERRPLKLPDVCAAPEVAAGVTSSGGDLYALTLLCRSLIPYAIFPERALRVLKGCDDPDDYELAQLFAWSSFAILGSHPGMRPPLAEAMAKEHRAWDILGVRPDHAALEALVQQHLSRPPPEITIDSDLRYVTVPGSSRAALGKHRALRGILRALIDCHRHEPGRAVSVLELMQAGWPGESLIPEAGANRVYVALSSLRKLGLERFIERCDGGWRLLPSTAIRVAAE